jgi:hypothetical protein
MNLEAIAPIIEDIVRKSLYQKVYAFGHPQKGLGNKVASGTLARSIQVVIEKNSLIVMMEEYGQYVDQGRRAGKGVPIKPLMKWIRDRGLQGRDKKGRFITHESFAFGISNKIKKYGIRPANFISVSMDLIMKDPRITELLGDATYDDLVKAIQGI